VPERLLFKPPWSPELEQVEPGVWVVRGDIKHGMNVYLLEDDGGVTAFDSGTKPMVKAIKVAAEKLGGLKRVVLGHSHSDHRGAAPQLGVPVHVHEDEKEWAEKPTWKENAPYWDMDTLSVPSVRWAYKHWLHNRWDGGAVPVAGTLREGDEVAGFEVKAMPGHAPGQIALWREADRLALTSDVCYFADSETLKPLDYPTVPHHCWNWDHKMAAESVQTLAELNPRTVLPGHEHPARQSNLKDLLERAAEEGGPY
jgi:glyoxylase-like metal-dependent hydrolase (beta-lactamase superfamily II)